MNKLAIINITSFGREFPENLEELEARVEVEKMLLPEETTQEELAERLEVPGQALGVVKVTLTGSGQALVEDHRGLLSYSRERVEIDARADRVGIDGEGLELKAMDREALLVTGRILSVELE